MLAWSVSDEHRNIGNTSHAEDAPVALGLFWVAHGFGVVIGELDRGPAVDLAELAHKADRIEAVVVLRIASAEIIRQQSAPAGAKANAAIRNPSARIASS